MQLIYKNNADLVYSSGDEPDIYELLVFLQFVLCLLRVLVTAWIWKMFTQHTHTSSSRFLIIIIIINRGIPLYLRQQ